MEETGLVLPTEIKHTLGTRPLVGVGLDVQEADDLSGLGVSLRWMSAGEMIEEAIKYYPGIAGLAVGFLLVGSCLEGSGDPYFVRLDDGAVVRIPHAAAVGGSVDLSKVEVVAPSIDALISSATLRR
jgi:hypothetical protein